MAVQETNLGHFDYIALYDKDATKLDDGLGNTYDWIWKMPTNMNRRRAPIWYISVVSCYCDDSTGSSAALPHFLRMYVPADNYYSNEKTTPYIINPIVSMLIRDTPAGHWYSLSQDNITIQIPSNIQNLHFDIVDGNGNIIYINSGAGESLNIILKVTYPERTEVMANTTQTYAQSIVGNIRAMNTF